MNFTAQIISSHRTKDLMQLFLAEEKKFSNGRAEYSVRQEGEKLIIDIKAQDSSALRAVVTSITKVLGVYEKTEELVRKADDDE